MKSPGAPATGRDSDGAKASASNCQWFCASSCVGGTAGLWETGPDLAAQQEGLSQCEQAQQALAGAVGQRVSAVKTGCAPASKTLNKMTNTVFTTETWRAGVAGYSYFLAPFFSESSIFLRNFLGFLSKSFLQSLQQSLISRPS